MDKYCQSESGILVPPAKGEDKNSACIDKPVHGDTTFADKDRPVFPQSISFECGAFRNASIRGLQMMMMEI